MPINDAYLVSFSTCNIPDDMSDTDGAGTSTAEFACDRLELNRCLNESIDVDCVIDVIRKFQLMVGKNIEWELVETAITESCMAFKISCDQDIMQLSFSSIKEFKDIVNVVYLNARNGAFNLCVWRSSWLLRNLKPNSPIFAFGKWRQMDFSFPECLNEHERDITRRCVSYVCNINKVQIVPELIIEETDIEIYGAPVLKFRNMAVIETFVVECLMKNIKLGISDVRIVVHAGRDTVGMDVVLNKRRSDFTQVVCGKRSGSDAGFNDTQRKQLLRVE